MTQQIPNYQQNAKNQRSYEKIQETQMPNWCIDIIETQIQEYDGSIEIEEKNSIPATQDIPLNVARWLKVYDVICVFVDMKNSTTLSAASHERSTARSYQLFTGTAIRLFDAFEAPYIDVKGDGVFALFNSDQPYRALAAAVSFKTFAKVSFTPRIQDRTGQPVGAHIGIDQKTVLVRKLGMMQREGRTDRQNEVWAGKPVNMAAKLASIGENDDLLVSDRFYRLITDDTARLSCGCPSGEKKDLWSEIDVSDNTIFDFEKAYKLTTHWCKIHGTDFCNALLNLDN